MDYMECTDDKQYQEHLNERSKRNFEDWVEGQIALAHEKEIREGFLAKFDWQLMAFMALLLGIGWMVFLSVKFIIKWI